MKKIIIFYELNLINILFFLLVKMIGFNVYFFEIQNLLKNEKLVLCLNKIGIYWVNYNKFTINDNLYYNQNIKITQNISELIVNKIWSEEFKKKFKDKNNLLLSISDQVFSEIKKSNQVLLFAKLLLDNSSVKSITIFLNLNLVNSYFASFCNKEKLKIKVRLLISIHKILKFLINFFGLIFLSVYKYLFLKKFFTSFSKRKMNYNSQFFDNCSVIYFPNKGSFNKSIDKTYFYSSKFKNLKKEKILHAELYQSDLRMIQRETLNFYRQNKINNVVWENLVNKIDFNNLKDCLNIGLKSFKISNSFSFLFIFEILYKLNYHSKILSKFKNLRIILLGHADIFPNIILIAARLKNIKSITFQTRLNGPPMLMKIKCIDIYYCSGKISEKILGDRYDQKMKIKKIFSVFKKDFVDKQFSNKVKNCLVIPYNIRTNWYDSGRSIVINTDHIMDFLEKVYSLSKKYKEINFFIKFKSNTWMYDRNIKQIVTNLKSMKNVKVFQSFILDKNIVSNIDLALGQPSSLIETCVSVNIPSLIYEKNEGYAKFVECFPEEMLCNKNNIIEKFDETLINYKINQLKIQKINELAFYDYSSKKMDLIKKEINELCQK